MTAAELVYQCEQGVARITLNRPERLNALTEGLLLELAHVLELVRTAPGLRVVVLTGAGRAFCAGADLSSGFSTAANPDIGAVLERHYNPLILALRALPVPVVAVVNGVAAGAGASLALAADLVLAARSARFVLAFARIGLVPDAGATYFLPQRIGMARALALALLGDEVDALEAERIGLIWRAVADADLSAESERLVERLAHAPTAALGLTKQALYASTHQGLADQLRMEREFQQRMGVGHDFKEGVAAFREKRAAKFRGC